MTRPNARILFWNIRRWQWWLAVALYVLAGTLYWLALFLTTNGQFNAWDQTIINFTLKGLLSLPVYWLIFVRLAAWPLPRRLAIHVFTMPAYIASWFFIYRWVCDEAGIGYLQGVGAWWDVYIPMLLYLIQFANIHAYEYYAQLREQQRREMLLQQAALRSEVNALKAQIHPHFLFNTLNSISASVPAHMERTRELIAQLADTFRFALQASEEEWIPVQAEMQFIETYLQLEKQRFGDRLQIAIHTDAAARAFMVPPMLLQPLVENAVRYAVSPSIEPVTISVSVRHTASHLLFSVADTGPGWPTAPGIQSGFGLGLRNTAQRLQRQFDQPLEQSSQTPHGAVVRFSLPIHQLPHAQ